MKLCVGFACIVFLITSCSPSEKTDIPRGEVAEDSLRHYTRVLSSDEFMGRMPFTGGEDITVEYLVDKMKQFGLEPGNGDQYTQNVPLVDITGQPDQQMNIRSKKGSTDFQLGTDFVAYSQREVPEVGIENSDLVFCGYGINAPEYNWNDFEGLDLEGKTIIVLVNDPGLSSEDSTFFKGNTMTYYGRWTYKYEEAARQGAAGVFIVHETNMAGYPWFVVRNSWVGSQQGLQSGNKGADKCAVQGWLSFDAAQELFEYSGLNFSEVFKSAAKPGFKPVELEAIASVSIKNTMKYNESKNVIARLPGTMDDENIIYSAHWDHFGISTPVDGDSIYNGAVDNATGVATLLEIARTYKKNNFHPRRSVVFLFVTAEEQGLLGSQYYAENPVFPPHTTVANLNLDALEPIGPMKDVTMIGYGHSTFDELADEEAKSQGRYVIPDQEPEKGYFFRSDHFNFAKIGIPAFYAKGAYEHMEKGVDFAKQEMDAYTSERYHQPSDEYTESMDFGGMVLDAQLYYNLGWKIASGSVTPEWKPTSEFGSK